MAQVRIPDDVILRELGDETVLLNLQTGQYFGLNQTGGRMFAVLAEVGDVAEAVKLIAAEYEQPADVIQRDVDELCTELAAQSLIILDTVGPPGQD
jgi:Coenzyme PQQ synthesis protein D (PqqD)